MKREVYVAAIVCVIVGMVTGASALQLKYVDAEPDTNVRVVHPDKPWGATYAAGVYQIALRDTPESEVRNVDAFCIDLKQTATYAWTDYEETILALGPKPYGASDVYPMGFDRANQIMELWGRNYDDIGDSDVKAAAFQIAVWEIIFDDGLNVTSGDVLIDTGAVATQAQAILDELDGQGPVNYGLMALVSDQYQCFVYDSDPGETPPVPEPVTLCSTVVGLCGLGSYIRKRTMA